MIEIEVPGRTHYRLGHLVLDVNGTLALDGEVIQGVAEKLEELHPLIAVHLITADTQGQQLAIDRALETEAVRITARNEAAQKAAFVRKLGRAEGVCAIGNGANDADMLREATLSIAVVGREGLAIETLNAADVVAPDVLAAFDLLLWPRRLVATLRR
jgi:P-type E1-E2 ATPase